MFAQKCVFVSVYVYFTYDFYETVYVFMRGECIWFHNEFFKKKMHLGGTSFLNDAHDWRHVVRIQTDRHRSDITDTIPSVRSSKN